ncbi:MAG: hypothetical protein IPO21_13740 [Bacteroidales bacterium]|nr:hypothetical protein [Bacteroidales bacterium]
MKKTLTIVLILAIIILTGFFMRNAIVSSILEYKTLEERKLFYKPDTNFVAFCNNQMSNIEEHTIELIIKKSLLVTSKQLNFTTSKAENNPNLLLKSEKANCVGYAQFYALVCNILLKKSNLDNDWIAKAYVAQLYVFEKNVHYYLSSPFWKNHDFVIIKNLKTNERIAVDPTLHDYFLIDKVALKN